MRGEKFRKLYLRRIYLILKAKTRLNTHSLCIYLCILGIDSFTLISVFSSDFMKFVLQKDEEKQFSISKQCYSPTSSHLSVGQFENEKY